MANLTLSVPNETKKEMDSFPEMNWSEIARAAIRKRIELLKKFKEFTRDSKMTEEDAIELGRKLKKGRFNRLKSKGLV